VIRHAWHRIAEPIPVQTTSDSSKRAVFIAIFDGYHQIFSQPPFGAVFHAQKGTEMPFFKNSPPAQAVLIEQGWPVYLFGSRQSIDSELHITSVAIASNVATVGVTRLLEGILFPTVW
jgi:hypothetical protein